MCVAFECVMLVLLGTSTPAAALVPDATGYQPTITAFLIAMHKSHLTQLLLTLLSHIAIYMPCVWHLSS